MTITAQSAGSVFGAVEQRVSSRDGIESCLELLDQVALDEASQVLTAGVS